MTKRIINNCYIDASKLPKIVLNLGKHIFEVVPENIMTEDKKILCSLYDVNNSMEIKDDVTKFVRSMNKLRPIIILRDKPGGIRGIVDNIHIKCYSFFGNFIIFNEVMLTKRIKKQADKLFKDVQKYKDRLTYMLMRMTK